MFAFCLLLGLRAGNPFSTIVSRALVGMAGTYVVGLILGTWLLFRWVLLPQVVVLDERHEHPLRRSAELVRGQSDPTTWPATKERLGEVFRTRTLDEWSKLLEGSDTCFTPVLTPAEAARHPHNVARGTFVEVDGVVQPAPAPN